MSTSKSVIFSLSLVTSIVWLFLPIPSQQIGLREEIQLEACKAAKLDELCQNFREAVACNVTPYCIHCVWNTAFFPENVVDTKCQECKEVILSGKPHVKNEIEYSALLSNACNVHLLEGDFVLCIDLVQNYNSRNFIRKFIRHNFSAHDTCSLLGLCFSQFEVFPEIPPDTEATTSIPLLLYTGDEFLYPRDEPVAMARGGGRGGGGGGGGRGGGSRGGSGRSGRGGGFSGSGRSLSPKSVGSIKGIKTGNPSKTGSYRPVFISHGIGSRHYSPTTKYSSEFSEDEEENFYLLFLVIFIIVSIIIVCVIRCIKAT